MLDALSGPVVPLVLVPGSPVVPLVLVPGSAVVPVFAVVVAAVSPCVAPLVVGVSPLVVVGAVFAVVAVSVPVPTVAPDVVTGLVLD